jgi:hypothetical protein
MAAIAGGVFGGLGFLLCIALIAFLVIRRRNRKSIKNTPEKAPEDPIPMQTIIEPKITKITDITVKKRLGGGHFSDVYQGEWQVFNGKMLPLYIFRGQPLLH